MRYANSRKRVESQRKKVPIKKPSLRDPRSCKQIPCYIIMTSDEASAKNSKKGFRKRLGLSKKKEGGGEGKRNNAADENNNSYQENSSDPNSGGGANSSLFNDSSLPSSGGGGADPDRSSSRSSRRRPEHQPNSDDKDGDSASVSTSSSSKPNARGGRMEGVMRRVRSLSRSRTRSAKADGSDTDSSSDSEHRHPKTIVTVTSCRSDGYYNQKAPGSTSKLPRKAPTNLKLFHELAVGLKDAYAAVGQTPVKPVMEMEDEMTGEKIVVSEKEFLGRSVLWEFIGNIDFVSTSKGFEFRSYLWFAGASCTHTCSFSHQLQYGTFPCITATLNLTTMINDSCSHSSTKLQSILRLVGPSRTIRPSRLYEMSLRKGTRY